MMKRKISATILAVGMALTLAACSSATANTGNISGSSSSDSKTESNTYNNKTTDINTSLTSLTVESESSDELFSKRDLEQTPDLDDAQTITVESGKTYTISEAGTYVFTGTATDSVIRVEADKEDKVQIVLDNLSITNENFPVIYVVSADKCFVTTLDGESSLKVTGSFTSDGDTKTDAVIYSKDDLVFNGTGTLEIVSGYGNGISGKDDIKVTGGTYIIKTAKDAVEANDSILVYNGSFTINSQKDGFHSENEDDDTSGYIYLLNGTYNITAKSDAIQATSYVRIDNGEFVINAGEGIEATYVQINGGNINITASDDGINASKKSSAYSEPVIEFNGGYTVIVMGEGDTDGVDSNGSIIINDGTIDVTATVSSFDYDNSAKFNGGTIIVNGEEVDEIPQSMMGGPGGAGGFGGGRENGGFRGRW